MRLRAVRGRADALRRPLLPCRDPVHHFRSRSRLSVPLGRVAWRYRPLWLLVDDRVPRRADHRLHVRVEEGSARMGVIDTPGRGAPQVVPPGPEQDLLLRAATEELQDRGFI